MAGRLLCLVWLFGIVAAGPITSDASKCSTGCSEGSKFLFADGTTYIYNYEVSNSLHMEGNPEMTSALKAVVEITKSSACEMSLQITQLEVQHGSTVETSSSFIDDLKRNPLPFSWDDGLIRNICPNPEDKPDILNVKRGILSALQNSMKSTWHDLFLRETDVLGTCDTDYKITASPPENPKTVVRKTKNLASCSPHLQLKTAFLATPYDSHASPRQDLPLLRSRELTCDQVMNNGIIEETVCTEKGGFTPLSDFGYGVQVRGELKLQLTSTRRAGISAYTIEDRKSLVFAYEPRHRHVDDSDAEALLRDLCPKVSGLLQEDVGEMVHKLVNVIRGLAPQSVENIYNSLKNHELCDSPKALSIYIDALKMASTEGAIQLLTKLTINHEISETEVMLWFIFMPVAGRPDEGSIRAALPLLQKGVGSRQAFLSVSAMAHKFCSHHPDCESVPAIREVISSLEQFLVNKCHSSNDAENDEIITALKSFGNLGRVGESRDKILDCALNTENGWRVRIAAVEAFRRTPCSETGRARLLELFSTTTDETEERIAAFLTLVKCPSSQLMKKVQEVYDSEISNQVKVFVWSYFENLKTNSDPSKRLQKYLADRHIYLQKPNSTDITKFSRNFQRSLFSELLNVGGSLESNLIFTRHSFLPRSLSMDFSVNFFGYKLDLLELGLRTEDIEFLLENVFGPRGTLSNYKMDDIIYYFSGAKETLSSTHRGKRSTNPYQQKIDVMEERVNFSPWKPQGSLYLRILGNELRWRKFEIKSDETFGDIDIHSVLRRLAEYRTVDVAHSFMFFDTNILIPSVTGRAYELAGNGSVTVGLKAEGKFDIQQPNFPRLNSDIDGKFQPSAVLDLSASMSLHSEDYEPGYKVRTSMNLGQEIDAKIQMVNCRKLYTKFNFPAEQKKIFSMKRDFYVTDQDGERKIERRNVQSHQFCTKYLDHFLGMQICGKIERSRPSDASSVIPALGSTSVELTVRKTDASITGYEFIAQMPEIEDSERIYKLSIDTPGSTQDRRYSTEIKATHPDSQTCRIEMQLHTPFYTMDGSTTLVHRPDILQLRVEATGDQRRKYMLSLDVEKNIRGARLAEYKPSLILSLPNLEPIVILGTVVFARGNKEQLSIDLTSDSFGSPFRIKGNLAKEGDFADLESDCRLATDLTVNFKLGTYRLQGTAEKQAREYSLDFRLDYQLPEMAMHNVQLMGKIANFNLYRPLSFSSEAVVRVSEYPDYNSQLKWDFSVKLIEHLKNDISFRYGRDFEDNSRRIHFKQLNKLHGDFVSYTKFHFENELAFAAPCIQFDKSAVLTVVWDFVENPKFVLEIGAKSENAKEVKAEINYLRLSKSPIKITTEAKVIYFEHEYAYRDQVQEIAPRELEGKIVIESRGHALVSVDYTYKIKSDARKFHHEVDSTIVIPGRLMPIQQKALLKFSRSNIQFHSHTDTGNQSPYVIDMKLNKVGPSEVSLQLPFLEGRLQVTSQHNLQTINANFQTKGRDERKILASGTLKKEVSSILDLEIKFDADNDPRKLIIIKGTSTEAESGDKHIINANINYIGAVNADISGTVGKSIFLGPHNFRADFSGNMEPTALVVSYQIKDWNLESFLRYLRSDVEKVRADLKGKFIQRAFHLDVEGGLSVVSPFKTFDGKEIYYKFFLDSSGSSRSIETEYRLKYARDVGYVGKMGYSRRRGWPGSIKAIVLFTVDEKPIYEARTELEYGNKKYSFTTNLMPSPKKRFNLDTSFEYAARYANFHHSVLTSFQHLQSVSINAVADLRQGEDLKILSNFNVNDDNLYDVNATFCSRSITDFEGQALLFSKITPSIRIRTKTNNGNSLTKYTLNVQKGDEDIMVGSGELRKIKKGFNADASLKYRENDILSLNINNDAKSQREQNYAVKVIVGSSTYTANVHSAKERRGRTKHTINLCTVNNNKCIEISTLHKETETKNEWSITYKREDVELNFEHNVARTDGTTRYHAQVSSAGRVYGYDIKIGEEGDNKRFSLGLLTTHRDMNFDVECNMNPQDFRFKLGLQTDAKRFPDRKLILLVKSKNRFGPQSSFETEVSLSHPIFEKKIEVKILGNLDISSSTPLTAELSADYSTNPEHKLITKIRAETLQDENKGGNLYIDVYHKDDQHLLLAFETNGKLTSDDFSLRTGWKWPAQGGDKQVNVKVDWIFAEHKMQAVYNRAGMDQSFTAVAVHPPERKTIEVDMEYIVNGVTTHSKLAYYQIGDCTNMDFTVPESGFSHKTEICFNKWNRKLLSVNMETNDEDSGAMHNSLEVIHQSYGVVKVRNQWNSDFIGLLMYHLVAVAEEVADALESPPETYEKLKSMHSYVKDKIYTPAKDFISRGYVGLLHDVQNELIFLKGKAAEYYGYLPPVQNLLTMLQPVGVAITDFFLQSLALLRDKFPAVTAVYEKLFRGFRETMAYLERYCVANKFCPALIKAVIEGSYSGFIAAIEEFVFTLPEQIAELLSHSTEIRAWITHACENVMRYMRGLLRSVEPLLQYRYINNAIMLIESAYESLKDQYGDEVAAVISDILRICHDMRNAIMDNENIHKLLAYVRDELRKLRIELQQVDVKGFYSKLRKLIEDLISNARLPSSDAFYKLNTYNSERGVLDVDFYVPVDISVFKRIFISLMNLRHLRPKEIQYALTSRSLVASLKRVADLNILPPYSEQAQIVGKQHFVTFDKNVYDFVGECSYLLSRDFDNGNFTLIVKYPERSSGQDMSLIMMVGQVAVEVNTGDQSVTVDERAIDLPFLSPNIRAVREGNNVIIDDRFGVVVKCHTVHKLCSVEIPGWYFGKTAGLFGKYNYESYDDFMRPRGHIAQNIANFAKSWEVTRGCRTRNLAHEVEAEEGTESYRTCLSHFREADSPLADCFPEVSPELYFKMCLRHLPDETDKDKALCNVATAYVTECEKNYLEINLPPKCLQCEAPDGSVMKHGERKKFEGSQTKTVDLVFVIENHSCNQQLTRDLNILTQSIEKELSDNGFSENLYSVVSYGGSANQPFSHTVRGKTSFNAQDIVLTTENFATETKLSSPSGALEAVKYAIGLPFRSGSSKTFVLLACTPCKYNFRSLAYPVVQQLLLEHGINLHVVINKEIQIRKHSARRDIVGVDAETVYSVRDITQKDLKGEPSLRSQVSLPKDLCVALSQDVRGSFFSSKSLDEATQTDLKNWRSILSRRVLKTTKAPECQFCDCTTKDYVAKTVCQPCTIQRPKLPFTVCKDCHVPRYVEPFVSFVSHLVS